ncbi:hypothetical protein [Geobacter sp. SVR]|uniref:hypothetical protein n=1 Tax=Geobacter sp. SVR TaxID=2495594 RepID=UPI00143EF5E5|nr:hypothetical protein [Geobacter sp. SVR]BCS54566.1 hypothetical protein GSVR_28740 [Geobacter sp. SVR]GCF86927.1 hypothetical protein GSbR_35270 [Geobacter sp. SVR]
MELSAVHIAITIGAIEADRAPAWWIEGRRGDPLGRVGVTLPDPAGTLHETLQPGNPLTIEIGYRDQAAVTWSGTVIMLAPGETRDQIEVRGCNAALPLSRTIVTQAWENETPEAIVSWAIRTAGLSVGHIDPTGVTLPRFVASACSVWQMVQQVIESCSRQFGLNMSRRALWMGRDGVNWSDGEEPGDMPLIATGAGLIRHEPGVSRTTLSRIETWLLPDLDHSRLVHLQDVRRGIDAIVTAQRVRHEGAPDRTRTFIWY